MSGITFTRKECEVIYELIDTLSGGNAENAFAWNHQDDPNDEELIAIAKLYKAAGQTVPQVFK